MKQGWEIKKLGEVCEILNGYAFKSEKYTSEGVRVLRITNVQKGYVVDDAPKFYPKDEMANLQQYVLKENDLLMSLTGNVGRVGLLQNEMLPAALNQRVACLRIKNEQLYINYLFHFLNSDKFENDAIFSASGIAQKNMSTEWLKKYTILVPPRAEQERIVEELDCLSGVIEKKRGQLKELDALAQSIFYQMFGNPITNEKRWEVKKLGEVANSVNYGTSSPATEGGYYTYIRMNNLTYSGYLDLNDVKKIDVSENEMEKCIVRKGDILFNRTNSKDLVGKTALFDLDEEMIIAGYIIRVRVNADVVLPIYVVRYMNTPFMKTYFRNLCKGAVNQANINSKELKAIPILMPHIELQQEYAEKIEAIEKQKELIKQSIAETEELFNSRMQYYFN